MSKKKSIAIAVVSNIVLNGLGAHYIKNTLTAKIIVILTLFFGTVGIFFLGMLPESLALWFAIVIIAFFICSWVYFFYLVFKYREKF